MAEALEHCSAETPVPCTGVQVCDLMPAKSNSNTRTHHALFKADTPCIQNGWGVNAQEVTTSYHCPQHTFQCPWPVPPRGTHELQTEGLS